MQQRGAANNIEIGGKAVVFAPAYGSPFVADLDKGRRYELTVAVAPPTGHPGPHWVIFNATSTTDLAPLHPGRRPFAVSNPIFF